MSSRRCSGASQSVSLWNLLIFDLCYLEWIAVIEGYLGNQERKTWKHRMSTDDYILPPESNDSNSLSMAIHLRLQHEKHETTIAVRRWQGEVRKKSQIDPLCRLRYPIHSWLTRAARDQHMITVLRSRKISWDLQFQFDNNMTVKHSRS